MSEPFFIETSKGIINRSQISSIEREDFRGLVGIKVDAPDCTTLHLRGEEARMFLSAIPVKIIVGKANLEDVRNFQEKEELTNSEPEVKKNP